jgi:hypothetical protein
VRCDPATIPDHVLASERGRRNAIKRKSYSGGLVWANHNPHLNNCRCIHCNARRARSSS